MATSLHISTSSIVLVAMSLLACAPCRVAASSGPEDLHRAVVKMHDLSVSLRGQLTGVDDSIERSRRIREAVRRDVVETIDIELCAEVASVSSAHLSVSRPGSDEESVFEFVYMEIVRRLGDDSTADARSELRQIRSKLRVDGGSALILYEAFQKQGMKWE